MPFALTSDQLIYAASLVAILTAFGHGYLGETRVLHPMTIKPDLFKSLLGAIWQLTSWDWIVMAVALISVTALRLDEARPVLIIMALCIYGAACGVNMVIFKARHFGGYLLLLVCGLLGSAYKGFL